MNIVSSIVGLAIMGAAAPPMLQMSIAPAEAQKRAQNLSLAESSAVIFSSANEGKPALDLTLLPDNCPIERVTETAPRAYDVTCEAGRTASGEKGRYFKEITRSFRLAALQQSSYTNPDREFAWETPNRSGFSHIECPVNDPWGVGWYNEHLAAGHLGNCIPSPVWSSERYFESNPDDWLFDLTFWGYGVHPDF